MDFKALDLYLKRQKKGSHDADSVHDADMADYLEEIKEKDEEKFFDYLNSLPVKLRAETFMELPTVFQADLILKYDAKGLSEILEVLDSDDATDVCLAIAKTDKEKEKATFTLLSDERQEEIERLIHYGEDEAGSLMQTELLKATLHESIETLLVRLAALKSEGIGMVQYALITDEHDKLLKMIPMDDLILEERSQQFNEIIDKFPVARAVAAHDSIETVLNTIDKYDMTCLPVVDRMGHLIGIITHDDIVDVMRRNATKQLYGLGQVHAQEEVQESFAQTGKHRALWLFLNLINAVVASIVIGVFEHTIDAVVALAILMPIVANMAGTASVQTMTVVVRQMALGEIQTQHQKRIFFKELNIAFLNGLLFAILAFGVSQIWFGNYLISTAMGLSMLVSFVSAGVLGVTVPMVLKKAGFDPAIASSVIVITAVDIIGFFSFLWFSEILVLS